MLETLNVIVGLSAEIGIGGFRVFYFYHKNRRINDVSEENKSLVSTKRIPIKHLISG